MVITRLLGGLGNQFFQYAAGRALAAKHGTGLKLDTSAFESYPLRSYALNHFRIQGSVLTESERKSFGLDRAPKGRLGRLAQRVFGDATIPMVREKSFAYDPGLLDAPEACYLEGYWQSPKYFAAIEPDIRSELTVAASPVGLNRDFAAKIAETMSVSLHVRRDDYVTNPTTHRYHGVCGPDYYEAAQRLLLQTLGNAQLFVFSDDPSWVEANLRFVLPATILKHNGPEQHYEDLRLMTLCKHHIVANSTFSWWGAWLCPHADKIVVAPKNWFKEAGHGTADLIPQEWRTI